jgi:hypothetical protein
MKKIRTPAEIEWRRQYGWDRYVENFHRTMTAIGPCALSPRAIASAAHPRHSG